MSMSSNRDNTRGRPGAADLEKIQKRLETSGDLYIVGLGDSLTYGWMVERGFYDRFVDRLQSRFASCAIGSVNAGIPGDTAKGGLARVDALLEKSPHLMTVQFGLNDMYQGISADEFHLTTRLLVERIRRKGVVPVLVTSCPLDWEEGSVLAESFYDHIRRVAEETDICCASLDRYWERFAGPVERWAALLQADHVHPTDKGHDLMAKGLVEALRLGEGRANDAE